MSDRDALLAAILADPDDDLPRLVYADWLDENGPALPSPDRETAADRAAFIRAQVEAARAEPFSPAARAAQARAEQTGKRHWVRWTRDLRDHVEGVEFVRGFVEHVSVEGGRFPQVADTIFEAEPVRSVHLVRQRAGLYGEWESLEPAFAVPRLRQVAALDLAHLVMVNVEYDALVGSPHLEGLKGLSLRGNPVPIHWLPDFLAGPRLPTLTGLDLSDIPNLGPATATALERAGHRRFTRLDLSGIVFRSDDLQRALASRCLREVEELRLGWADPVNPGPLTHLELGWVVPWGRLRLLDLTGQGLGSEGAKEIARKREAAGLRWLGLASNRLGPGGAAELASAPHLKLYHLDVRDNDLGPRDVEELRRRFPDAEVVA